MITEIPIPSLGLVALISHLGAAFVPAVPEILTKAREDLASQLSDHRPQGASRMTPTLAADGLGPLSDILAVASNWGWLFFVTGTVFGYWARKR